MVNASFSIVITRDVPGFVFSWDSGYVKNACFCFELYGDFLCLACLSGAGEFLGVRCPSAFGERGM